MHVPLVRWLRHIRFADESVESSNYSISLLIRDQIEKRVKNYKVNVTTNRILLIPLLCAQHTD